MSTDKMVLASQLHRFQCRDRQATSGQVLDVVVKLAASDYPQVTALIIRCRGGELRLIPWHDVVAIDAKRSRILVGDLQGAPRTTRQSLNRSVLVRRDMLDALVLDLERRRGTRVNDVLLEEARGEWEIRAADTGIPAMVRRLTRGVWGRKQKLVDWKYIEFLRGDPQAVPSGAEYHRRTVHLPSGEIATLTEALPYLHAAELICLLPDDLATDVLEAMSPERQLQVFEEVGDEQELTLLNLMAPNEAADLLARLHVSRAQQLLNQLPESRGTLIADLLRYPEDVVGGIMTNDVVIAPADFTVGQVRVELRDRLAQPDFVNFVYVVDSLENRQLRGVIPIRSLLICEDDRLLQNIMNPYLITLQPLDRATKGANEVLQSHLAALPVIAPDRRLLGVVTIDEALAVLGPAGLGRSIRIFS
ncbi:MAG: hypothetical protein NVS4B8_01200 [Herpetosiphon sp.]